MCPEVGLWGHFPRAVRGKRTSPLPTHPSVCLTIHPCLAAPPNQHATTPIHPPSPKFATLLLTWGLSGGVHPTAASVPPRRRVSGEGTAPSPAATAGLGRAPGCGVTPLVPIPATPKHPEVAISVPVLVPVPGRPLRTGVPLASVFSLQPFVCVAAWRRTGRPHGARPSPPPSSSSPPIPASPAAISQRRPRSLSTSWRTGVGGNKEPRPALVPPALASPRPLLPCPRVRSLLGPQPRGQAAALPPVPPLALGARPAPLWGPVGSPRVSTRAWGEMVCVWHCRHSWGSLCAHTCEMGACTHVVTHTHAQMAASTSDTLHTARVTPLTRGTLHARV